MTVTHLDGHHHVHVFPGIRSAVFETAQREQVPFVRRPSEAVLRTWRPWRRLPERLLLASWSRRRSDAPEPRCANHFRGLTLFASRRFESGLHATLLALPAGITEVMVHPAAHTEGLPDGESYARERLLELSALQSPALVELLRRPSIRLTHFGEL